MKLSITALIFISTFLFQSIAFSSGNITGQITFFDTRTDTDNASNLPTSLINTNKGLRNAVLYIYDMDGQCIDDTFGCSESDDDLLDTIESTYSGHYAFYVNGPQDVYIRFEYENKYGQVLNTSGSPRVITSSVFANNISSDVSYNFSVVCNNASPSECTPPVGTLYRQTNMRFANILQSLHDSAYFLELNNVLSPSGYTGDDSFTIYHPQMPSSISSGCSNGLGAQARGYNNICIGTDRADDNHVIAHEVGHILHSRLMQTTSVLSAGSCGSGYTSSSNGNGEKCVMVEGWANFVGSAVYFDQDQSAWWANTVLNLEGDTMLGNNGVAQQCITNAINPHRVLGNAARYFWDLYDSTTIDDSTDNQSRDFEDICDVWNQFPQGTSNRQVSESGINGRNVYDYSSYTTWAIGEISDNCLTIQAQ